MTIGGTCRAAERTGDADGGIKLGQGYADLCALCQGSQFRCANVRSAAQQIRGDADNDGSRRRRYPAHRPGEQHPQRLRWNAEQHAERVFALLQLYLQLGYGRSSLLEYVCSLENVKLRGAPALEFCLSNTERFLLPVNVVPRN